MVKVNIYICCAYKCSQYVHGREVERKRRDVTMCPYPFTPQTGAGQLGLSLRLTDRQCLQALALVPEGVPDVLLEHWSTGRDKISWKEQ